MLQKQHRQLEEVAWKSRREDSKKGFIYPTCVVYHPTTQTQKLYVSINTQSHIQLSAHVPSIGLIISSLVVDNVSEIQKV
jgi:hypothetical protein